MSQQDVTKQVGVAYPRRLFVETGFDYKEIANSIGFELLEGGVEIRKSFTESGLNVGLPHERNSAALEDHRIGRIVEPYTSPTPSVSMSELKVLSAPSRIHVGGVESYKAEVRIVFPNKAKYAEFRFFIGKQFKLYDETGGIFVGAVEGPPEVNRVEAGKRYDVKLTLKLTRKNVHTDVYIPSFTDVDDSPYLTDIIQAAQVGITATIDRTGQYVQSFKPGEACTRGMAAAFLNRTRKIMEKVLSE